MLFRSEIIRNNQYIYTHTPTAPSGGSGSGVLETQFEFRDKEGVLAGGAYYYIRVWAKGDHYAWSSPIWVE